MQLSSPPTGNSPTVTQTTTTVPQGVPQNQQNIVMVRLITLKDYPRKNKLELNS